MTLIAILVMMVALAFLALAAMNTTALQERMAGNSRDKNLAIQAGEAALRDAEADIQANLTANSGFSTACTNGLCMPPSIAASGAVSTPAWQLVNWDTNARTYGSRTGATALLGPDNQSLAKQPSYIVELLPKMPPSAGDSACTTCAQPLTGQAFRITVQAYGARPSTVVMLQSTYVKQ